MMFRRYKLCIRYFMLKRWSHTAEVRVRFAPSPTGDLHLGGLRTALYNYLFARNQNGKFILRIEDTDQTRLVPGAQERIVNDLQWAGIEIDEGPGFGGMNGPYVQSERTQKYSEAVQQLLDKGQAYRCFCTDRRLDLLRKQAVRLRQLPRYDNKCRHLRPEIIDNLLQCQTPYCVRFKLSEEVPTILNDLIYGRVEYNIAGTEGDPVIMKSDNLPTYHLANVVDDHLMSVTHVLRGVEWQISTPKHLMMYRAFGWQPPQYGHLPLLVNADGSKLSKRQGDIGIKDFREKGYFPEALNNYVLSAGGGFQRPEADKPSQLYALSELSSQFTISRLNAYPSRLNSELLSDFNRQALVRRLSHPATQQELVIQVQNLIKKTFGSNTALDVNENYIAEVLKWSVQRITLLNDLTSKELSFIWVKPAQNQQLSGLTIQQLQRLLLLLNDTSLAFTKETLGAALKNFVAQEKLELPPFMKCLRSALCGLQHGPSVAEIMYILGRQTVIQRLQASLGSTSNDAAQEKHVSL